jgi:site-specific DNA-methyltransferase (adenine-specific)
MLLKGNCLDLLAKLPDNSVDSIVTDPPYELGFMGKSWDNSGIAYNVELWAECLRVLKPGGHLLAFGGSRTYHRLACAVEDAGFEVRDQIMWLYGSGFPKSLNLKDEWAGWGTALKPAHEPIVVARKPLTGTVANNVLEWGTGALNIDGSRVGTETITNTPAGSLGNGQTMSGGKAQDDLPPTTVTGRWPANVIHDGSDEVLEGFPDSKSPKPYKKKKAGWLPPASTHTQNELQSVEYGDEGSAARFFYCAKASKSERNAGLEGLPEQQIAAKGNGLNRSCATCGAKTLGGCDCPDRTFENAKRQNFHPTVKPIALMRYLVKMVTPLGGTVLDPFLGSGTTACAAILEGFEWLGCEMTEDYWPIIEARVLWAEEQKGKQQEAMF